MGNSRDFAAEPPVEVLAQGEQASIDNGHKPFYVAKCLVDMLPGRAYVSFLDRDSNIMYMTGAIRRGNSTSIKEIVRRAFRQAPQFLPGGYMTYAWNRHDSEWSAPEACA